MPGRVSDRIDINVPVPRLLKEFVITAKCGYCNHPNIFQCRWYATGKEGKMQSTINMHPCTYCMKYPYKFNGIDEQVNAEMPRKGFAG